MNIEALFLFLILLLGLVLCSFLGGNCGAEGFTGEFNGTFTTNPPTNPPTNPLSVSGAATPALTSYDNYQHGQGSSTGISNGAEFIGKNGGKVIVTTNSDGTQSLNVTLPNDEKIILNSQKTEQKDTFDTKNSIPNSNDGSITIFTGPNDANAKVITTNDGKVVIRVEKNKNMYEYTPYTGHNDMSNTQYYGSTGYNLNPYGDRKALTNQGPNGNVNAVQNYDNPTNNYDQSNKGIPYSPYATNPSNPNNPNSYDYASSLPPGIPGNMIPPGHEDLYILKSQVVPPVCPACPSCQSGNIMIPRQEPCPACKPCGRCPEPSFECKKVPNYNAIGNNELPIPVLNDFSTFGM